MLKSVCLKTKYIQIGEINKWDKAGLKIAPFNPYWVEVTIKITGYKKEVNKLSFEINLLPSILHL